MPPISTTSFLARLAKGELPQIVVLEGADSYLRQSCRERLLAQAVDPAAREWGICRFSAEDGELAQALGQAQTLPMLARRQVVIIAGVEALEHEDDHDREAATKQLEAYISNPAPLTVLILESSGLDSRMKLGKILTKNVLVVRTELPEDPEERVQAAAQMAQQMAREEKTSIEPAAAQGLAESCNSDLASIRSEIAKLATYVGAGRPISPADVDALVVSEKTYSVWQLADMLASRQRARAFAFLDNLLREGEPCPAVVGAMAWMYRALLQVHDLGPGVTPNAAAGRLKMRYSTAELAVKQARKIPRRQLVDGIRALYDADSQLKSAGADDRAVMEFLLARLTHSEPEIASHR